jgi:serine/threonine protein kinase
MEPRRRFRILKELAEGAFGKVYLAEMITGDNFKSVVAIKLLHGKWVGHEEIVRRSRDEARVLGLLHHRNIVRVEDLTSINGQCAVIMEYLEGVDLKSLIRYCKKTGQLYPRRVAFEIAASTATALQAAYHRKTLSSGEPLHLIHRDIKPSNVMVTVAGEVKVLDFGTARAEFAHREAETKALSFGSAAYMAPERMMGDPDGPAGDIFSLGITLYEMLASESFGKIFIRGEKFDEALDERIGGLNFSDLDLGVAENVRHLLRMMLAYEPEERPTAQMVVDMLEALADQAQDGSLRRFCRDIVSPAHKVQELPSDPNDPFTGSTLFEDSSRLESRSAKELVEEEIQEDGTIPSVETGAEFISDGVANGAAAEESSRVDRGQHAPPDSSVSVPFTIGAEEKSSNGLLLLVAVLGLVLGIGFLYGVYENLIKTELPKEGKISAPVAPKYLPGSEVQTGQAGGKGGNLVMELEGTGSANVTISAQLSGYNFKWDGTRKLSLNDLESGTYRVLIRANGETVGLEAEVEKGRTCAYLYSLSSGSEEWLEVGC